jgi:hypothetical protein
VKLRIAPGASVAAAKTGVEPVRSFVTTTFVNVIVPALLTLPEYVSVPPKVAGTSGQFSVTTRRGALSSGQIVDAVLVTSAELQASLPLTVTVLLMEQASRGVLKLAVKFAEAPAARLGTVKTVLGEVWLSITMTLFNVTLPVLLTVPV